MSSPIAPLRALLPPGRVLEDPADRLHYGRDWTRQLDPAPIAIALPEQVAEVQTIVRWCAEAGVAIVPSGGRTGLSGGALAARGELVVSLERMRRVLGFDATDRCLVVEAGITLHAVQEAARERGLSYPVDFAARGSCQIGGNIATNAGGIKVIRHGLTRHWVAGLKLVDGRGELLDLNRGLVKNATGYDLRHLVIGSEGTLGLVVEATLRLAPAPPPAQVMVVAVPHFDALMRLYALLRERLSLSAFEFFNALALRHVVANGARAPFAERAPYYVLAEFDADEEAALAAFEAASTDGLIADGVLSQSEAQARELWRLREGITESLAPHMPYKNDISVRIGAVAGFLAEIDALLSREYPHFEVAWFGHIGDGNLHINVLKPASLSREAFVAECGRVTELLAQTLARHGGSISAEHGVGLFKKPYLGHVRSAHEIALMREIKRAFDPAGILNPGKLIDL